MDERDDSELLQRMADGDEAAFTALYRRYQPAIFRFALQMSGSRQVAEDITQEVFLLVIRGKSGYRAERGPLASYLYGVARNLVLRALHRERGAQTAELDKACGRASDAPRPDAQAIERQRARAVRAALLSLPPHYREVVVLCELHDMDYQRAAQVLGCAVGTVRSRLHRAREMLAARLRAASGEEPATGNVEPAGCPI